MKIDTTTVLVGVGGALVGYGIYRVVKNRQTGASSFFAPWVVRGPPPPGLRQSEPLIAQLKPPVQTKARELLQRAINLGIPLVVTQAYRDPAQQARLYAQGRTTPGAIVTNAPPGWSWHEYKLAFDVAVLDQATGRPTWPNDNALWQQIGAAGKAAGLEWGGDWTGIVDRPHFQFTMNTPIASARAGQLPAQLAGMCSFRLAA
jgi:peptidoglycan L-alanyl-D-glutamate endopeptidase CwlK